MYLLALLGLLTAAKGTLLTFQNTTTANELVPLIQIPRILDNPQTVPIFNQKFFIYGEQGTFCFDLDVDPTLENVWLMGFTEAQWAQVKLTKIPYLFREDIKGLTAHPNLPSVMVRQRAAMS
eukprot:Blabericola_migrator_1__4347@NODE_2339_length_2914_cov_65_114155_g682_i2_p3_GENE_NODE_2339_length_2914_cov_65_114155_g682_i2NODE_2339_length_2914_cov_65_114155_g682_i2_p3_ORF_typecomplete_len122_score20_39_NODE_2339_length_2914_cov_65_114155_g682_i224722837